MSVSVLNTTASLSGKTLALLEGSQTFTGAKTFDLGASAPFVVMSGSAVVANLDADKLDGFEATAFPRLAAANAFTSTNTFTGNLGLAATVKLYLDGVAMSGDTYISESSANVLSLFSGGVEAKLTSGVLTLGVLGTHTITGGSNAAQTLSVINTTSGTAGKVEHLQTAGTAVGRVSTFSQGFTPSGLSQLSSTLLEAQAAGGLSVAASHASGEVRFYSGGTTLRGAFTTTGLLALDSNGTSGGVRVVTDPNSVNNLIARHSSNLGGGVFINFQNAAATLQGSVTATNSTTTAFNTSSDQRLKRDKGAANDLTGLRAVRVRDFDWLTEDGGSSRGVFAQDVIASMPQVVTKGTDERNEHGQLIKPWAVDYSKFVPDLIVGWQQHDARLAALEARLASL